VTANSWYFGHLRDQARWLPSQKGHLRCSKGHLFGRCWSGLVGQIGRFGQMGAWCPRLKHQGIVSELGAMCERSHTCDVGRRV
jgi:hypothetical protein